MSFLSLKHYFSRVEEWIWYLFLIMLPFQTRHIFGFESWSFVEWNALSLYATDVVLGILIIFRICSVRWNFRKPDLLDMSAVVLAVTTGLSVFSSSYQSVSMFHWIKLLEGLLLFWYVRHYPSTRFSFRYSLEAFLAGSLFQAVIAIGQFLKQSDLGLWFLGESVLSPHLKGIASFYVSATEKVIRAYGTTPHPNILASYLGIAAIGYWYYFMRILNHQRIRILSVAGYAVIIFGLLMTFSRTVIFVWALVSLILWFVMYLRRPSDRRLLLTLAGVTAILCILFAGIYWSEIVARFTISTDEEAVTLRLFYGKQAFHVGSGGLNWTGIGMGNFVNWFMEAVPTLPRYLYQPVHNVYLLAYSETGILGSTAFGLLMMMVIWRFVRHRSNDLLSWLSVGGALALLLFVGFFDHFPWTLQQGRLLWWLVLGAAASVEKS